jgi:signal transduction histidine kinase
VKYSADGDDVTVRVEVVDGEARLTVIDQGVGISPDNVRLLFKRFYRADATGAGGLGLGLHISEMLVRAHGGRIWATSNPGEGSTFTVALPLSDSDENFET